MTNKEKRDKEIKEATKCFAKKLIFPFILLFVCFYYQTGSIISSIALLFLSLVLFFSLAYLDFLFEKAEKEREKDGDN